jgi:uncharacterized membrane protein YfcA
MTAGAVFAAFVGTALVGRLSNERLERVILVLLVTIGTALIVEAFLPQTVPALVPALSVWQAGVGAACGLAIGLVSSLLGVAGGELIIPAMVFLFGADIKTAGTASLLISLPTVTVGVIRYARRGAFSERQDLTQTVVPMGVGSILGAVVGGLLVGLVAPAALKFALGAILLISAARTFGRTLRPPIVSAMSAPCALEREEGEELRLPDTQALAEAVQGGRFSKNTVAAARRG